MKKLGLPKLLETVWVRMEDEDEVPKFEILMESIDNPH